jgi:hypothetical protein
MHVESFYTCYHLLTTQRSPATATDRSTPGEEEHDRSCVICYRSLNIHLLKRMTRTERIRISGWTGSRCHLQSSDTCMLHTCDIYVYICSVARQFKLVRQGKLSVRVMDINSAYSPEIDTGDPEQVVTSDRARITHGYGGRRRNGKVSRVDACFAFCLHTHVPCLLL